MRATTRVYCKAAGGSKGFYDQFQNIVKNLGDTVRGGETARMLDPETYRPTPKYRDVDMQGLGPQSKKQGYNYYLRENPTCREFTMYVPVVPEISEGPGTYYDKSYKPLRDVLERLYPEGVVDPPSERPEGNVIPTRPIPQYLFWNRYDQGTESAMSCDYQNYPQLAEEAAALTEQIEKEKLELQRNLQENLRKKMESGELKREFVGNQFKDED